MDVTVDGVIYTLQPYGGISRVFTEILPRMCQADSSLQIKLLTRGQPRQPLPSHPRILHSRVSRIDSVVSKLEGLVRSSSLRAVVPRWIKSAYEHLLSQVATNATSESGLVEQTIWHSTYFTMPESWTGAKVVTVYDMIHERFRELFDRSSYEQFRAQKKRAIRSADTVICISETTREDVEKYCGVDPARVHVVHLAHSELFKQIDQATGPLVLPKGALPYILYVGSRAPYKNFDFLLDAYQMWRSHGEVALVVVGVDWSNREIQRLKQLDIVNRVYRFGEVDDDELCFLYNRAMAYVLPSLYEGFGIPLLEAMACGCLVIASRIPSTIEVAGEYPIYFEPTDVESLVAALETAESEGQESARVAQGLQWVKRFSWDTTAEQTLALYRDLG